VPQHEDTDEMIETMARTVLDLRLGQPGELIIITGGIPLGAGRTNFLKVHRL